MNEKETELLKSLIGKDEKVLEMGCGTGRLLLEMEKAGYDLTGFDFSDHIKRIKEENPEAKVFEGDWHQTGLRDESFDAVYSLGRNILHDYSIVDQVQLFREANRVLKKGGRFIFDIPNREKGSYKMMTEEYASEMVKRGIKNFRYGSIYDSPDGINFATRYAYSEEDIKQLAEFSGFRIVKREIRDLETGKGDENWYYVLEKIGD
jgi:ubiquinone/menaquinone biosynthesis C-methylase UbiE